MSRKVVLLKLPGVAEHSLKTFEEGGGGGGGVSSLYEIGSTVSLSLRVYNIRLAPNVDPQVLCRDEEFD